MKQHITKPFRHRTGEKIRILSDEKISKRRYYLYYTVLFCLMMVCVFGCFFINKRSFVWKENADGFVQHYTALSYYARWLRSIIKKLLFDHVLEIPTFSFSIGYGSDIISTLCYYVIGDPIALFAVFVREKYLMYFYCAMILFRYYLAGISFSLFCHYIKERAEQKGETGVYSYTGILVGAMIYVFCGYALLEGVRHPYFLNPMVYFPLVLLGVEKILDGKKPFLLVIAVFLSAINNFYFFYMIVVLTVLYVGWRLLTIYSKRELKKALGMLMRIGGCSLLGTCMSAVLLLPAALGVLNSARTTTGSVRRLFYTLTDYESNLGGFLYASIDAHDWSTMGYASIALICVILLFLHKEHKSMKIAFVVLTLMTLFPAVGRVMNGFSYASNRWLWGYAFLLAYIVVLEWKKLFCLSKKERLILFSCVTLYFVVCVVLVNSRLVSVMFALAAAFIALEILQFADYFPRVKYAEFLLAVCILGNITGNAMFLYSQRNSGYIEEFISYDDKELFTRNETPALKEASKNTEGFFRYSGSSIKRNKTLFSGLHSTQYFWSLENHNISEFRADMALTDQTRHQLYETLDSRTILSELLNVRYYVQDSGLPYGYTPVETSDKNYTVYENECFLPFGYTYDNYISEESYDAMTLLEKQEAMLQGCVINGMEPSESEADLTFTGKNIDYDIQVGSGAVLEDDVITVTQSNATVTLTFEGMDNAETYLYFTGLQYSGIPPMEMYTDEEWEKLTTYEKNEVRYSQKYYEEEDYIKISVSAKNTEGEKASKTLPYFTPMFMWYSGREDFLVNLGYDANRKVSITLKFPTVGKYAFDSMEVLCQPMDRYPEQINALGEDVLENVDFHDDNAAFATKTVTGTISLDSSKYLLLTIPYSRGWRAYVDGREQEILRANTMNMALRLDSGEHEIVLTYETPGLKAGAAISIAAAVTFVAMISVTLVKRKRGH